MTLVAIVTVAAPERSHARFVESIKSPRATVWAVGDGADRNGQGGEVAARISDGNPDRFLYLGDVYEDGTAAEFERNYASIFGEFDPIAAPTPGNHEWPNRHLGYYPYWSSARSFPTPDYYAFRVGGWQVLSLNSETAVGPRGPQSRWLKRKLRRTPRYGNCRIAFWHRPRYSAGASGDAHDLAPLWRMLGAKARLAVSGHDHTMQRHRPVHGITQFVAGAGGHELRGVNENDPRLAFSSEGVAGALQLQIDRRSVETSFVSSADDTLDRHRISCRRRPKGR